MGRALVYAIFLPFWQRYIRLLLGFFKQYFLDQQVLNTYAHDYDDNTVGKNARSSKTKMYKQKSDELSIITIRYMHKAKKTTPVPDLFLK